MTLHYMKMGLIFWSWFEFCRQAILLSLHEIYFMNLLSSSNKYILFQQQLQTHKYMKVQEILALDHINIQDITELKQIILQSQLHIDGLVKQVQELNNSKDRNQRQYEIVREKMASMSKQNQEKKKIIKSTMESKVKKYESGKAEIIEHHEKTMQNLQFKHTQLTLQLDQKIKSLREQQQNLRDQEQEEYEFQNQIKEKSACLITKQYDHHDHMNKQKQKEQEENRALFEKNKNLIKELKKDVKMEAGKIVYQQKYENEDKNYELKVRLFQLQEQVTKLRKERNDMMKIRNEQKINVSLNEEEVQEYKAVGSIQKSKIKIYSDKVQALKKTISSQISKLQTKIKEKKTRWQNQLKSSKLRLFNLQKQKQQLRINLQRYKLLGQTILMQREQVEQFFLMSIQACKKQLSESQGMLQNTDKQYGEKVDIDELLPKDKLRIITNLYTKLALAPSK